MGENGYIVNSGKQNYVAMGVCNNNGECTDTLFTNNTIRYESQSVAPYGVYDKKKDDNPNSLVDYITLVCMGHEPDLTAAFKQEVSAYKIDVEIVDILTDKKDFEFKREAQAKVSIINNELVIESFYPMNLMQKLSIQKENVDNYKQLVESVMIDWNYDGLVLKPSDIDIPDKNDFVKGKYTVPSKHGKIKIKITDLLSESLELEVE
jgi:hypothetical protein